MRFGTKRGIVRASPLPNVIKYYVPKSCKTQLNNNSTSVILSKRINYN